MKHRKQLAALMMAGMMLISSLPLNVLAVETPGTGGLCEHHPQHTDECGYEEGTEGAPCSHEHTEDCYTLVTRCLHEHTQECYPADSEDSGIESDSGQSSEEGGDESIPEEPSEDHTAAPGQLPEAESAASSESAQEGHPAAAAMQLSLEAEPTECTHVCSEENGCITKQLDCQHQHDESCGYSPAAEGTPCTFVCEICGQQDGDPADWPETPDLPDGPPALEDGQMTGEIYGQPRKKISAQNLALMQSQSQTAAAALDESLRISEDGLDKITFIYVNGTPYVGGDLTVTEGDNFSYMHTWAPASETSFQDGSWFEYEIFRVPGLNLKSKVNAALVINGIRIGEYEMNYDQTSGKMTYRAVFNRYVQFFDPATVLALLQGSGKFSKADVQGEIANGTDTGMLTINPRPPLPEIPTGPGGGTGWSPSKAPAFNDNLYPFGKGMKWSSKDDPNAHPQIEWRVVFLEQLQKTQQAFLDGTDPVPSDGYLIIEEKLDANQRFYYPINEAGDGKKYDDNAPFFLELPVMVPGTGNILNGLSNTGDSNYDGPGEIYPAITGASFKEISGNEAHTIAEINKVQEMVRQTPLTWTVTTHPSTGEQTLLINVGILGTTDKRKGITWEMANEHKWPDAELDRLIRDCDDELTAIQNGGDSPITLLDTRQNNLLNQLQRAAARQDDAEAAKAQVQAWHDNYQTWRKDPKVTPLSQLVDENGHLVVELPKLDLAEEFETWTADGKTTIGNTDAYKDYIKSLENLQADQKIYTTNRLQYGEDWKAAREYYEKTREFYKEGRIYGFVLKLRSESINTSANSYKNSVGISVDKQKWNTDDTASVQFSSGIIGNFSLGDVVVQKADAYYNTDEEDDRDIQEIGKQNAGLPGAKFEVYSDQGSEEPNLTEDHLAHFLDKDASENGDTYIFTHIGDGEHAPFHGDITEMETDAEGRLILGRIPPDFNAWLVEKEAPDGYYLDKTPVKIGSEQGKVTYKLRSNTARSVLLHKIDSFSKNPVEGAEFTLYKKNDPTPVTGFSRKTINGHETYWYDKTGSEILKTNAEGQLCIHGLDAGSYVLKETKPAPGYLLHDPAEEFPFDLLEELPKKTDSYDEDFHYLLNTAENPLENEPDVASLTVKKQSVGKNPLSDAGFALFRFTGTETDWNNNPDDEEKWESVALSKDGVEGKYFKTDSTTKDIPLVDEGDWEGDWNGKTITAAYTDTDGFLIIDDIPTGHYSIAEVEAPETYNRDKRSFYFTVDGTTAGKEESLQLYTNVKHTQALAENTVTNYRRKIQLALVKYDAEGAEPSIAGEAVNDGHLYTEEILQQNSLHEGVEGAVYKLFMRRGGSEGMVNPHPQELITETIQGYVSGYDTCLAVGATGKGGVLRLSDMKGRNGQSLADGLNPGNYYLIEVKAPEGYLLDQDAIHFKLDEKAFPDNEDAEAGLVMTASNSKADYGIRLQKVDGSTMGEGKTPTGLPGAEFNVKQSGKLLYFTGSDGTYQQAAEGTQGAEDKVVTGKNGMLTIIGLKPDTEYTFIETKAPLGFHNKTDDGETVAVTLATPASAQDGRLADGVLYPMEVAQVKNDRLLGKMLLHKEEAETGKALAGAEFTLYRTEVTVIPPNDPDYDPNNPNATRSEDVLVAKEETDADGNLVFDHLEWEQFYYVMETRAPEGYLLDQTKRMFSIDEDSFNADGSPIPVLFPLVSNSKGALGKAVLYKADEEDHSIKLEDAHFYLMKKVGTDAGGEEIWTGYGQGMYITDKQGEIRFLLPPGDYKLIEMKAPEGYILEAMKELPFTIPEMPGEEALVIDEPDSDDGVVTNRKGDSGVRILKTLGFSNSPVPGVTFQIGWEVIDIKAGTTTYEPLYFIHHGEGNYEYVNDKGAPGATNELVTDGDGLIYAMMPANLRYEGEDEDLLTLLYYQEIKAPAGLELKSKPQNFTLTNGIYTEANVSNDLKPEETENLSITIHKMDGKSKKGLPGAEFTLYWYDGTGEDIADSHIPMGTGTTDGNGTLIFDSSNVAEFPGLMAGETYHIVETKAPQGYILDETHYEVTLDAGHFDENFNFTGVPLELHNYQISGSVRLTKADAEDGTRKLEGAEFELLRREESGDPMETGWKHYGEWRYTTDENGKLHIENLPYGSYQLVERAAPLGYLLDDPAWTRTFQIDTNGQSIDLGVVTNKADPNPARDVYIRKVAAHDYSLGLPGAEFELYERQQDGNYHLRQKNVYVTDADGEFVIGKLPVGSYALKEIKAPAGYDLPEQTMTCFVVQVQDREVRLQIENAKTESGGSGGGDHNGGSGNGGDEEDQDSGPAQENGKPSLKVKKVWEDHPSVQRPDSILIQLYRNDTAYGRPVVLNADNHWQYRWNDLEEGIRWTVDEFEVPDGYQRAVSKNGNTWTITNTAVGSVPTDPNQPIASGQPEDPNRPAHVSQTGDFAKPVLWIALAALSAAGCLLVWIRPVSRKKKKKKKRKK